VTRNLRTLQRILLLSTSFIAMASYAGEGAHWGYSGPSGPDHWAELSKEFAACAEGRNQSPIDIAAPVEADLTPYRTSLLRSDGDSLEQRTHDPGRRVAG
jgi:carbonic anhydrase